MGSRELVRVCVRETAGEEIHYKYMMRDKVRYGQVHRSKRMEVRAWSSVVEKKA